MAYRPAELAPNDPITFAEAAEILLRRLVKASTLRAAADRGELRTERLGRRRVTTPAAVLEWRETRQERRLRPGSAFANIRAADQSGGSAADRAEAAVQHALMVAEELKRRSKDKSQTSAEPINASRLLGKRIREGS